MKTYYFLFMSLLFMTSCSSGRIYQNYGVESAAIAKSEKGVVVMKIRGEKTLLDFGIEPKVSFDLAKVDDKTLASPRNGTFYRVDYTGWSHLNPFAKKWAVLMVDPGFYVIDNFSWKAGNTRYSTNKVISPSYAPVSFGAFVVKPGTVNYVGDLEFKRDNKGKLSIEHTDHFQQAQEELRKSHADLADRLEQIEFLPAGFCYRETSIVSENEDESMRRL